MTGTGIDDISLYLPKMRVSLDELAQARGWLSDKSEKLGIRNLAVPDTYDDPVSMAANAARKLNLQGIDSLVVATESGIDHAQTVASYVHDLLGLPSSVGVYDMKQACVPGLYALENAVAQIRADMAENILVICTDIARYPKGSSGEPTQGAGAVAFTVTYAPSLLEIDPGFGTFTKHVDDFWRPNGEQEARVNGRKSLFAYNEALIGAYEDAQRQWDVDPIDADYMVMHVPFPNMSRTALSRLEKYLHDKNGWDDLHLHEKLEPSLQLAPDVGNIYTGSAFMGLISLLASRPKSDGLVNLFGYGSGSSAKMALGELQLDRHRKSFSLPTMEVQQISPLEYDDIIYDGRAEPMTEPIGFHLHSVSEDGLRKYAFQE